MASVLILPHAGLATVLVGLSDFKTPSLYE